MENFHSLLITVTKLEAAIYFNILLFYFVCIFMYCIDIYILRYTRVYILHYVKFHSLINLMGIKSWVQSPVYNEMLRNTLSFPLRRAPAKSFLVRQIIRNYLYSLIQPLEDRGLPWPKPKMLLNSPAVLES